MTNKKEEKRQRNHVKAFRLNDEELAAFLAHCKAANLSGGDLFRTKCCKQKALKPIKRRRIENEDILLKYLAQVSRLGNNLNQIAHALNVAKFKPDATPSIGVLSRHENTISEIQTKIDVITDLISKALEK